MMFTHSFKTMIDTLYPAVVVSVWIWSIANTARADRETSIHQRYRIEAYLDTESHTIEGTEWIDWHNNSHKPANQLYLHLYLNAFRNDKTVFMREKGFRLRNRTLGRPGRVDVITLRTSNGTNLLSHARTDLIANDKTQMVISLPQRVPPFGNLSLIIKFRSTLPQIVARSGYDREFNMVAQWYPKLARRRYDGRWVSFPYHGLGEFYADFARYQLFINVPRNTVVGASGKRIASRWLGKRRVDTFVADRVHDVAWCAYPYFEQFVFSSVGPRVHLLAPRGYNSVVGLHRTAIRVGLRHFSRLFGAYPYETLTVVIPPRGAEGAMGMEYPTLFVTSGPWFYLPYSRIPFPPHEITTVHELAHQWFQGIVANNEVNAPLLDEGIAQWATGDLLRKLYGQSRSGIALGKIAIDVFELFRTAFFWSDRQAPSSFLAANRYSPEELVRSIYLRPALVLETARRVWGRRRFERALGNYARAQRFRHPDMNDLFSAFNKVYWPRFSLDFLRPALAGKYAFDARINDLKVKKNDGRWQTSLYAERLDSTIIPSWVSLRDSRRKEVRIAWPAGKKILITTVIGEKEILSATVDPDRLNLLDSSQLDNNRVVESRKTRDSLLALLLFWTQTFLALIGP
jgi:hypothetical protein